MFILSALGRLSGFPTPCWGGKVYQSDGMRGAKLPRQGFSLVFTPRPHMSFTVWLIGFCFTLGLAYLPEDPCEKLPAFLAIVIVWPLVLRGHA